METLAEVIQMSMFFGNDISFKKDDISGSGVMLVLENQEHNLKEQVLLPLDHIKDEKFIKYIKLMTDTIYKKAKTAGSGLNTKIDEKTTTKGNQS